MSQQINLLRRKDTAFGAAAWMVAAVVVVLGGLLVHLQMLVSENDKSRRTLASGEQQLSRLKGAIQALQKQRDAQGDAASIAAEIAALRPRVQAVSQVLQDVGSGGLGNPEGFARYLTVLSGVAQEDVWVTSVIVTKDSVIVSGRALRNDSVMPYAHRLNEAFSPYGVKFDSLDLTPENLAAPANAPSPPLATVAFKLS